MYGLSKKVSRAWHWVGGATKIRPPTASGAQSILIHVNREAVRISLDTQRILERM